MLPTLSLPLPWASISTHGFRTIASRWGLAPLIHRRTEGNPLFMVKHGRCIW
jgi:hypothetical protein